MTKSEEINEKSVARFLKRMMSNDFAVEWVKQDRNWHIEEWRNFIRLIREETLSSYKAELVREIIKLPDTYEDNESAVFRTTKKEILAIINKEE